MGFREINSQHRVPRVAPPRGRAYIDRQTFSRPGPRWFAGIALAGPPAAWAACQKFVAGAGVSCGAKKSLVGYWAGWTAWGGHPLHSQRDCREASTGLVRLPVLGLLRRLGCGTSPPVWTSCCRALRSPAGAFAFVPLLCLWVTLIAAGGFWASMLAVRSTGTSGRSLFVFGAVPRWGRSRLFSDWVGTGCADWTAPAAAGLSEAGWRS